MLLENRPGPSERRDGRPVRMYGAGETGGGERSRQQIAVTDGKPNLAAAFFVEIGMAYEKAFRFLRGRLAKAIDIVVPVALGMGDADQGPERQILLHGKTGLAGEVLARDKMLGALRAPFRGARGVDDGLVDALAGFRRDAAIAERAGGRKGIVGIVGLVDDEIAFCERAERRFPRDVARHRLLDIEQL